MSIGYGKPLLLRSVRMARLWSLEKLLKK